MEIQRRKESWTLAGQPAAASFRIQGSSEALLPLCSLLLHCYGSSYLYFFGPA